MVILRHLWTFSVIIGHSRTFLGIKGYLWTFIYIRGDSGEIRDIRGYFRTSLDIFEYLGRLWTFPVILRYKGHS